MLEFISMNNTSELRGTVHIHKIICIYNYSGEARDANCGRWSAQRKI